MLILTIYLMKNNYIFKTSEKGNIGYIFANLLMFDLIEDSWVPMAASA